jgi:GH25 family lysozyme M1 (1,4-beta-N-acetylmuramidase)
MGLDAAGYQYDMNWASIKAAGYTFAYEKATQGNYYIDPYYSYNITQAKAQGIAIGSYDFADFGVNPVTEADYFWKEIKSTISGDGLTLQPMLDAEKYQTGNEDSWIASWATELEADGAAAGFTLKPIVYTYQSWERDYLSSTTATNFPLWFAWPGSTAPTASNESPWTTYEVWQYGETGSIPTTDAGGSIPTSVQADADQLNGDANELRNLIVGEGRFLNGSTVQSTASVKAIQGSSPSGSTSITVASGTKGTVVSYPTYYNDAWYFDISFSNGVTGWVNQTSLLGVAAAPVAPVNSSPTNNSTVYAPPTLTWNSDPTAATFNIFLNNSEVASGITSTSYATSSSLSAGTYSWYVQAVNVDGTTNGSSWSFTLSDPVAPTNSSPANNSTSYLTPTLTWNASTGATTYSVYINNSLAASSLTTTSYTPGTLSPGTYSWYVQAKSSVGFTNGSAWSFTIGQPTPTATFYSQSTSLGASVFDFSISYTNPNDSQAQVDTTTFDNNDITVTGPNGYSQNAAFISQSQPGNGNQRSATYEIAAPNGAWNVLANGTYTIALNNNQVADVGGGYATGGSLGTFTVVDPFAYINSNEELVINATSSYPSISLGKSGANLNLYNGSSSLQYSPTGLTGVEFIGTSGNDSLSINTPLGVPLTYNGGSGSDTLLLSSGTLNVSTDLGATTSALTVDLFDSAHLTFSSDQHLAALNLYDNASVSLAPGGTIALETQSLQFNGNGYLDIADNALVVYGASSDDLQADISSGMDNGAWDGSGIISSVAATTLGYSVGFAPATSLSYSSVNGVSFSSQAIVVRYTADGDANLDGTVNADDLSLLMLAQATQQQAQQNNQAPPTVYWYNGDFNYDSQINADDYGLLSLGSAVQNQNLLG